MANSKQNTTSRPATGRSANRSDRNGRGSRSPSASGKHAGSTKMSSRSRTGNSPVKARNT